MESQRVNGKPVNAPEVGEVVLVVGEEKNRSEWKGCATSQRKGRSGTWCDAFTQGAVTLSNDRYSWCVHSKFESQRK